MSDKSFPDNMFSHQSFADFNKMSRKDKYEPSNRRQQTYMSAEDVAAGRKSSWSGVEVTGEFAIPDCPTRIPNDVSISTRILGLVRNISPQLWQFEHLTALYLNDNCLTRLPSDIGALVNLRTLDLSNNKLRSLPAELGELIQLRWGRRAVWECTWNFMLILVRSSGTLF